MSDPITFKVQGSSPEPYTVIFAQHPGNVRATCSCDAAKNGMACKHRMEILAGNDPGIVSGNVGEVPTVRGWLAGTLVASALQEVERLEVEANDIKKRLTAAKKELGRALVH